MKCALVLLCLSAVVLAKPNTDSYVPGQYILRIDEQVVTSEAAKNMMIRELKNKYNYNVLQTATVGRLHFLVLEGNDENMIKVGSLTGVKYIERNNVGSVDQCAEQPSPGTWGLDRIDQQAQLPYSDPTSDSATYNYGEATGTETSVYVIDSGIDVAHSEFVGRGRWGFSAGDLPEEDDNGHGTHCAGTVGGSNYGVAKDTEVVAVKVINWWGSGVTSDFVLGMDWILSDHEARRAAAGGEQVRSVVSSSLGYPITQSIDDSVDELTAAGIVVVTSAGNDDGDACGQSPARAAGAIAIGATDVNDVTSWFSNYGSCVDLYAPGSDVLSAQPGESTGVFSGTSMACPHVAGAAARYMSSQSAVPTPDQVLEHLRSTATVDAITWYNDRHSASDNLLLYSPCPL